MEFIVDKVSEDSFYENLLIGLPKILGNFFYTILGQMPYFRRKVAKRFRFISGAFSSVATQCDLCLGAKTWGAAS